MIGTWNNGAKYEVITPGLLHIIGENENEYFIPTTDINQYEQHSAQFFNFNMGGNYDIQARVLAKIPESSALLLLKEYRSSIEDNDK